MPDIPGLSKREHEVIRHVVDGLSNKQIGRDLGLSPNTVKTHLARILEKTGSVSRAHLVRYAYENGVCVPGGTRPDGTRPVACPLCHVEVGRIEVGMEKRLLFNGVPSRGTLEARMTGYLTVEHTCPEGTSRDLRSS